MSPSNIDQGRKCNWPMPLAAARREPHKEIKLDMRVDYIAFTKPWIEKLKDSTQRDPHHSDGVSTDTTGLAASKKDTYHA